MKTFNNMKTAGDILSKDITAPKRKMERPVIEIIPLGVFDDVIVDSPANYETEKDYQG